MTVKGLARGAAHAYVAIVAGLCAAFVVVLFAFFVPSPTGGPVLGTIYWLGVPTAVLSVLGRVAWVKQPRSLAVGVWAGSALACLVLALPVWFSLEMGQTTL